MTPKFELEVIKDQLRIPEAWLKIGLPGEPKSLCSSPFRADRHPSFAIYDDGRKWKDHATGACGSVVDFVALAYDLDFPRAVEQCAALLGLQPAAEGMRLAPRAASPPRPVEVKAPPKLPPLHRGSIDEVQAVADSRGVSFDAVSLAHSMGMLAFGKVCGFPSWIVTDGSGLIAEGRRVDRELYPSYRCTDGRTIDERKSHTITGSDKSWPIGVARLATQPHYRAVLLLEGGPDLIAGFHMALKFEKFDVLPIAFMSGGIKRIHPKALKLLAGRRIRIVPHNDAAGALAAETWGRQLQALGCVVDLFPLAGLTRSNGDAVNDLNDCCELTPTDETRIVNLLP